AAAPVISSEDRFYSPLVRNIAKQEGVSQAELDVLPGTGKDGRVTKDDILAFIENRNSKPAQPEPVQQAAPVQQQQQQQQQQTPVAPIEPVAKVAEAPLL